MRSRRGARAKLQLDTRYRTWNRTAALTRHANWRSADAHISRTRVPRRADSRSKARASGVLGTTGATEVARRWSVPGLQANAHLLGTQDRSNQRGGDGRKGDW